MTLRFTPARKAEIVIQLFRGEITRADALATYDLTDEELMPIRFSPMTTRRLTTVRRPFDCDKAEREQLRRMAEPEPLRSLRLQKERIERERQEALRDYLASAKADRLRREISEAGHVPCA